MATTSRRRPRALFLTSALLLAACSAKLPGGVDDVALIEAVGAAVGDPATCVVVVEAGSGKEVWRSSRSTVCGVERQACIRRGTMTVHDLAKLAAKGATITTGCESVSWAAGPTPRDGLVYAAVMFGERALPGMEMDRRLQAAFKDAGF